MEETKIEIDITPSPPKISNLLIKIEYQSFSEAYIDMKYYSDVSSPCGKTEKRLHHTKHSVNCATRIYIYIYIYIYIAEKNPYASLVKSLTGN